MKDIEESKEGGQLCLCLHNLIQGEKVGSHILHQAADQGDDHTPVHPDTVIKDQVNVT